MSALEVSQLDGRAYQNMDALGSSWLHYGVHAVSHNIVGSGVHIVFPKDEFLSLICMGLFHSFSYPPDSQNITGLLLSPFQTL